MLGRGEDEQLCSRGGSSANEGSSVDGDVHKVSQSTGSGSPMAQGDCDGDNSDGFSGNGELEGDRRDGSRGQGD